MSHLFEDYREIKNVRDKLDFILELVQTAPRRVFLTEEGKVRAVVLSPKDYEDLWNIELDRDMKLCDEEPDVITHEEFMKHMDERIAELMRKKA
jgi:PHD/YefM family antitoxin component YafN of YafNO toxin-antitoxin module